MYLGKNGQRVLRILHMGAAASWLGSALCVLLLLHEAPLSGEDEELFGMLKSAAVITQQVLVPVGAFGTFFTGLAYSLCTRRGFFKYPWIACKWCITAALLLGTLYLCPQAGQELDAVYRYGLSAYRLPDTAERHFRRELGCAAGAGLLAAAVVLSVCRPGEKSVPPQS